MMNRSLILTVAALGTVMMAGCVGPNANIDLVGQSNPLTRYTLRVEPTQDRIALAAKSDGLSERQRMALSELASRYRASSQPGIVIELPTQPEPAAVQTATNISQALQGQGIPATHISLASYETPGDAAPVVVGFETIQAHIPRCGSQWGNLGRTGENAGSSNFGCAVNANLAAQIAEPHDIASPRGMTPPSAQRRTVVFDNYRQGKPTAADPELLLSNANVSNVVE